MGLPQYCPEYDDNLRVEAQKKVEQLMTERDPSKIEELLKETFADRRNLIVRDRAAATIVKDRYGQLCNADQVRSTLVI